MCLRVTSYKSLTFVNGKRIAYKAVLEREGKLYTFYTECPISLGEEMISNRTEKGLTPTEIFLGEVEYGIHVFDTLEDVDAFLRWWGEVGDITLIVEVECLEEDLVATGRFGKYQSSVFTKILPIRILTKEELVLSCNSITQESVPAG